MGVTQGGILVPRPYGYDWEIFDSTMGLFGALTTYMTADTASTIKIVTRVPHNASIDDFDKVYLLVRRRIATVAYDITITNLRTSLVIASRIYEIENSTSWVVKALVLSKSSVFLPGDPIEIEIAHNGGGELDIRTWQKGGFLEPFPNERKVGSAVPYAQDNDNERFQAPALFLTWQDADANVITEWMPGFLPLAEPRDNVPATGTFHGNEFTMPFTDRRASGLWCYARVNTAYRTSTVRIYSEPADATDFPELYSMAIEFPPNAVTTEWKMLYFPFNGEQPRLVQGETYIVGIDETGWSSSELFRHKWFTGPEPVHLGFDNLIRYVDKVSGQWVWHDDYRGEFGLVFEESET